MTDTVQHSAGEAEICASSQNQMTGRVAAMSDLDASEMKTPGPDQETDASPPPTLPSPLHSIGSQQQLINAEETILDKDADDSKDLAERSVESEIAPSPVMQQQHNDEQAHVEKMQTKEQEHDSEIAGNDVQSRAEEIPDDSTPDESKVEIVGQGNDADGTGGIIDEVKADEPVVTEEDEDSDAQSTLSASFVNVELSGISDEPAENATTILGDDDLDPDNATTKSEGINGIDPERLEQNHHTNGPHPNAQFTQPTPDSNYLAPSQQQQQQQQQPHAQPKKKILHHPLLTPLSKIPWNKFVNLGNACDAVFNCKYSMRQVEDEVRRETMIMSYGEYEGYAAERAGGNTFDYMTNPCGDMPYADQEEEEEEGCTENDFVEMGLECCSMLDNDDEEEEEMGMVERETTQQDEIHLKQENDAVEGLNNGDQASEHDNGDDGDAEANAANETAPLIPQVPDKPKNHKTESTGNTSNAASSFTNLLSPDQKADLHWKSMKPSADMLLYRQFYDD